MEEEKKLPKNIRQMAEKEERVRVYLEDYAYTFIRKLKLYRACTHWYIAWKQNGYRKQKMLVCKGSS